jgi:hypothetical protein
MIFADPLGPLHGPRLKTYALEGLKNCTFDLLKYVKDGFLVLFILGFVYSWSKQRVYQISTH